ncbi:hypothetical protein EJ066_28790 [Mesorhizobium sp. M9A.F.Ca.ET.002.03.1.2]|uniref:hypothetical protein n=1 Tax=Mesorhizobium sp. M9A.F.Ca.ET.002.03.1.2 TaxID=2493668 RepID=UPI000F752363|nr:hypothetical protein [Mesorhizobium sp. M9A.F.Ca.ET.002.03.1.2]AZO00777.1 hypothetical protein EJ066_28790 [Mesorhizobium sp. M9A.F.Ca.ET.002.03.1.2]
MRLRNEAAIAFDAGQPGQEYGGGSKRSDGSAKAIPQPSPTEMVPPSVTIRLGSKRTGALRHGG